MNISVDFPHFALAAIPGASERFFTPSGASNGRCLEEQPLLPTLFLADARHPASTEHLQPVKRGAFGIPRLYASVHNLAG